MLVDLMVYDLTNENGGTNHNDFEDCIAEFMLERYNVNDDQFSIEEMAILLMTVRKEFTETATTDCTLESDQYCRLKLLNEEMKGREGEISLFNAQL